MFHFSNLCCSSLRGAVQECTGIFCVPFQRRTTLSPPPANLLVNRTVLWTLVGSLRSCPFSAPSKVLDNVILVLTWLEHSFLFLIPHPPIIFPNLSRALTPISLRFLKSNSCRHYLESLRLSLNPRLSSLLSCSTGICRSLHPSC